MLINLLCGLLIMGLCLLLQSVLLVTALRYYVYRQTKMTTPSFWSSMIFVNGVMVLLVIGNITQVAIWAVLFLYLGEFSEFGEAVYQRSPVHHVHLADARDVQVAVEVVDLHPRAGLLEGLACRGLFGRFAVFHETGGQGPQAAFPRLNTPCSPLVSGIQCGLVSNMTPPTATFCFSALKATTVAARAACSTLSLSLVPKRMPARLSTTMNTLARRSSLKTFLYICPVRAVSLQFIKRSSSPNWYCLLSS